MTQKHTPAPYYIRQDFLEMIGNSKSTKCEIVSFQEDKFGAHIPICEFPEYVSDVNNNKENSAFVVRACNMHDDLVTFTKLVAAGHLTAEGFTEAAKRVLERNGLVEAVEA